MRVMKTQTETVKMINGNNSFKTVALSSETLGDMATIASVLAMTALILSMPIVIYALTTGLGN